jgi:multidrug transporter EmrE-like cation transporter
MPQAYLFLIISIIATVTAQLLLKKGVLMVDRLEFSFVNLFTLILRVFQNPYLFFGLISFVIAFFSWLFVLSKLQLNLAYPVVIGLNFCLIAAASWFFFKEQLSLIQILGIAVIISGIFLLLRH